MMQQMNLRLLANVLTVNFLSFTAGGSYSWTSPVLPKLISAENENQNPFGSPITPFEESILTSLLSLGAATGPFLGAVLVDRIGRKRTLTYMCFPMFASYVILAFANQIVLYYVARFLLGLGVGTVYSIMPMYVGEISEKGNRGAYGCIMSTNCTIGTLLALCVGPYVSIRIFCLFCNLPVVMFLLTFGLWGSESPYFYLWNNKREEAKAVLYKLRNGHKDEIDQELRIIEKEIEESKSHAVTSVKDFLKQRAITKGLLIGLGIMLFQQSSAISVITSNMTSILEASDTELSANISAIIIGCVQVLMNLVTVALIDRLGRKILLILSLVGSFVSLLGLGLYFYFKDHHFEMSQFFWLPISSLVLYIVAYSIGLGPVAWAMTGELFPPHFKSLATTLVTSSNLFLGFLVLAFFPNLKLIFGMGQCFFAFATLCALGIVFVVFLVPETKGKSFQEIQIILGQK